MTAGPKKRLSLAVRRLCASLLTSHEPNVEEIKQGLLQALEVRDILEWETEEAEEVDDEFAQWVESETAEAPPIVLPRGMKSLPYH